MMREAVCFSVVLKYIWVGEYNTINQHNCKKIAQLRNKSTTAKKMAQLRKCTQESQKKLAQLRKKQHNCETKCTTAKKSTTAKHIYCSCTFFGNNHFSLSLHLIPCPTPCHPATAVKMKLWYIPYTSRAAPILRMYILFSFLLLLFSLAFIQL